MQCYKCESTQTHKNPICEHPQNSTMGSFTVHCGADVKQCVTLKEYDVHGFTQFKRACYDSDIVHQCDYIKSEVDKSKGNKTYGEIHKSRCTFCDKDLCNSLNLVNSANFNMAIGKIVIGICIFLAILK